MTSPNPFQKVQIQIVFDSFLTMKYPYHNFEASPLKEKENNMFKKKKKSSEENFKVLAVCPHCGSDIGLHTIRNYLCPYCNRSVLFYKKAGSTEPHPNAKTFDCPDCGILNFEGIRFCPKCGHVNIPVDEGKE